MWEHVPSYARFTQNYAINRNQHLVDWNLKAEERGKLVRVQALARGWAARKRAPGPPPKLGAPLVHPMTRSVHPMTGFYTSAGGAGKGQASAAGGAAARKAPPRAASPRLASPRASSPRGGTRRSQLHTPTANATARRASAALHAARAAVDDATLQADLEKARHKQVRNILG